MTCKLSQYFFANLGCLCKDEASLGPHVVEKYAIGHVFSFGLSIFLLFFSLSRASTYVYTIAAVDSNVGNVGVYYKDAKLEGWRLHACGSPPWGCFVSLGFILAHIATSYQEVQYTLHRVTIQLFAEQ